MLISEALAFHETMGSGTTFGDFLPLLVIAVGVLFALIFMGGRKKSGKNVRRRRSQRSKL